MTPKSLKQIGWREWVSLPGLGVPAVKAKLDTGARTSALHATHIQPFTREGAQWVRFTVHPLQRRRRPVFVCEAVVVDQRAVISSNGQRERRYFIRTEITLGDQSWLIDLSLTHREGMSFRMLLGRSAIRGRFVVSPATSFLMGKRLSNAYKNPTIKSTPPVEK